MAARLPSPDLPWPIPLAGVELIARYESCRLVAYRCPAGVWTIGWGETDGVRPGDTISQEEADKRLCTSLEERVAQVLEACTDEPSGNELAAMTSLQYNIGHGQFLKSSVLRAHNRRDPQSASRAFGLFNMATVNGVKQVLNGLTARRAAEAALYLQPDDGAPQPRMPQAVEPSVPLATSPTVLSGTAAAGVGVVSVLGEASSHVGMIGGFTASVKKVLVEDLGIPAGAMLPMLLAIFGGVVVFRRYRQRFLGWV